jgi:hypothetical protein
MAWCEPVTSEDADACDRYRQFNVSNIQNKMQIPFFALSIVIDYNVFKQYKPTKYTFSQLIF